MARFARRKRSMSVRKKTRGVDWVYNRATYAHTANVTVEGNGFTSSVILALVDAHNTVRVVKYGTNLLTAAGAEFADGAERVAGKGSVIRAVEGFLMFQPTVWDTGSAAVIGARIVALDQDAVDGGFMPPVQYNMWGTGAAEMRQEHMWANAPQWLQEKRSYHAQSADVAQPLFVMSFRWKGRWRLQQQAGLGLYLEVPNTSEDVRVTDIFMRTALERP